MKYSHGSSNIIYGLGIIGAVVYYLQHATTFLAVLIGLIKAVFWPAFILYKVLGLLKL